MWLLRFHLIETRDYNKFDRIVEELGYGGRKISTMVLVKGVLLHSLQGKSWRQSGILLHVSHIVLYNFYKMIYGTHIEYEILRYAVERGIALYIEDEKYITEELLQSDELRAKSLSMIDSVYSIL